MLKEFLQITMTVAMIDRQLAPIYLKSSFCKTELSGEDLAVNCVIVLESFDSVRSLLRDKLTGGVVDGVHIRMNVSEHLSNNIGIQQNWSTISWDFAHLLELAIGDTQKQNESNWLQMITRIDAEMMNKYSYGKQSEFLIQAAKEIQEDILNLNNFAQFVPSALRYVFLK